MQIRINSGKWSHNDASGEKTFLDTDVTSGLWKKKEDDLFAALWWQETMTNFDRFFLIKLLKSNLKALPNTLLKYYSNWSVKLFSLTCENNRHFATAFLATIVCALWLADKLARFSQRYPLTSVTWLYRWLSCTTRRGDMFFFKLFADQLLFLIDRRLRSKLNHYQRKCLVVSIASPGLFRFSEHDFKWPLARGCWKLLPVCVCMFLNFVFILIDRAKAKSINARPAWEISP